MPTFTNFRTIFQGFVAKFAQVDVHTIFVTLLTGQPQLLFAPVRQLLLYADVTMKLSSLALQSFDETVMLVFGIYTSGSK